MAMYRFGVVDSLAGSSTKMKRIVIELSSAGSETLLWAGLYIYT